jgi:hypothetical protein
MAEAEVEPVKMISYRVSMVQKQAIFKAAKEWKDQQRPARGRDAADARTKLLQSVVREAAQKGEMGE